MSAKTNRMSRGVGDSPAMSVSSAGPSPSRVREIDDNSCSITVLVLVLHAGSVLGKFNIYKKTYKRNAIVIFADMVSVI